MHALVITILLILSTVNANCNYIKEVIDIQEESHTKGTTGEEGPKMLIVENEIEYNSTTIYWKFLHLIDFLGLCAITYIFYIIMKNHERFTIAKKIAGD